LRGSEAGDYLGVIYLAGGVRTGHFKNAKGSNENNAKLRLSIGLKIRKVTEGGTLLTFFE